MIEDKEREWLKDREKKRKKTEKERRMNEMKEKEEEENLFGRTADGSVETNQKDIGEELEKENSNLESNVVGVTGLIPINTSFEENNDTVENEVKNVINTDSSISNEVQEENEEI
jgi:hypothetical protein